MPRLPYTNFHDLNLNWFLKEFKKIIASVSGKQDAPAQAGTAGQVLGLNDGLQPVWVNPEAGGTTDYTELDNKPSINGVELSGNKTGSEYGLIDTPAAPGTAGQVLGLDASLTPKWIDQEGGSFDFDITGTASGAIASFDDGANNEPLLDLQIAIEPVQDLHGYNNPWPAGGGVNLLNPEKRTIYNPNGYGLRWYYDDGFILRANQAYTFSVTFPNPISLYIINKTTGVTIVNGNTTITCTVTEDTTVYFQAYRSQNISTLDTFQLEYGTTATAYTPYSNICPISGWDGVNVTVAPTASPDDPDKTIYPFIFPGTAGTVYGGTFNPVTGLLAVTYEQISSYNGETLPGSWMSDRDAYTAGATPTIGAQVVYELANPIAYNLSPTEIRTLLGNNNIWASTGDILQCVYKVDPDIYLRNIAKVKILTPAENTLVLKPFPTTYNFGERTTLTLTATSDTYYKFMFKCPDNSVTNITINGAADTAGDIPAAGKTYIVEIWAGIANYTELVLAVG